MKKRFLARYGGLLYVMVVLLIAALFMNSL